MSKDKAAHIEFSDGQEEPERIEFDEALGLSILQVAMRAEVLVGHSCGGNGICTTCRVFLEGATDDLDDRNGIEAEVALERGYAENERLACQTRARDGFRVKIPRGL